MIEKRCSLSTEREAETSKVALCDATKDHRMRPGLGRPRGKMKARHAWHGSTFVRFGVNNANHVSSFLPLPAMPSVRAGSSSLGNPGSSYFSDDAYSKLLLKS